MLHCHSGLYFERLPGGGVRVLKRKVDRVDSPALCDVTLDADTWSTVVEAMADPRHTRGAPIDATPFPPAVAEAATDVAPTDADASD